MSTWGKPTFMRRRHMRLMAEEQQRLALSLQRKHLKVTVDGLEEMARHMAAQVAALPADRHLRDAALDAADSPPDVPPKPMH